jgi:hypothetical protein
MLTLEDAQKDLKTRQDLIKVYMQDLKELNKRSKEKSRLIAEFKEVEKKLLIYIDYLQGD